MRSLLRIIANVAAKATSFRVVVALVTSSAVTAGVAGPLAYQAIQARDAREMSAAVVTTTTTTTTTAPPATVTTAPSTTVASTTTTTVPDTTTTTAKPRVESIVVAGDPPDDAPQPLDGTKVTGQVFVSVKLAGATAVSWYIDDPSGTGAPTGTDVAPTLQLFTGSRDARFDTTKLSLGVHTLLARITKADGTTTNQLATFEVDAPK